MPHSQKTEYQKRVQIIKWLFYKSSLDNAPHPAIERITEDSEEFCKRIEDIQNWKPKCKVCQCRCEEPMDMRSFRYDNNYNKIKVLHISDEYWNNVIEPIWREFLSFEAEKYNKKQRFGWLEPHRDSNYVKEELKKYKIEIRDKKKRVTNISMPKNILFLPTTK